MASDWLGVSYAPSGDMFDESPTWERLDTGVDGLRVASIRIRTGRQSEFEQTGTGTCEVVFRDRNGVLDPTTGFDGISRPFAVAIRDPMRDEWFPLFRGVINDAGYGVTKHVVHQETAIVAVDALDFFSNFELIPGLAGFDNAQVNKQGYVFYEDAGFDERVLAVLGDCDWPAGLTSVFTGNIICSESVYSSGDKVLQVIQEACDAEFPTVANYYIDKRGRIQVHGRYARFDPEDVSASATNWDFRQWKVGDNAAAKADQGLGGTAKMQEPYGYANSRDMIRNAALAYPQGAEKSDLSAYIYTDESSRGRHGTRTWTAPNLQIAEETTIGMTAKAYCQLLSQYIINNYSQPIPRINQLTIGTEHPDLDYADAAWEMICESDVSDTVDVTMLHPGGGGFNDEGYFIEGRSLDITPGPGTLDDSFPIVKMGLDLSSRDHWADNPFGGFS